ncbi:MAG: MmgE/PrpD family protein [Pseudomonadota bacterium]
MTSSESRDADALRQLLRHVIDTDARAIPEPAAQSTRMFLLDSLGVGVNGSADPDAARLLDMYLAERGPATAGVFGTRARLAPADAAFMNAFQIHNAEYDCVHEGAVVHPMAVILGAVSAGLEDLSSHGIRVSGLELQATVALAVDVAAGLGIASKAPLSFFRPATAGCFGATLALSRLYGLSAERARHAAGIALGQLCGTMQAHIEGSPLLAMQVGFNARNAWRSVRMAEAGVHGPHDALAGPFGYFKLFEGDYDMAPVLDSLGARWRICEVAHKPFPSGRATHGIIDACMALQREHGFVVAQIDSVHARVPPLTHRLIGRLPEPGMNANYARLCGAYVTAVVLRNGDLQPEDFTDEGRTRDDVASLAARVSIEPDENPDPNALTPISIEVVLEDGRRLRRYVDTVYGNPDNPMQRAAWTTKFRRNVGRARHSFADAGATADAVLEQVDALETVTDAAELLKLLHAPE